MRRLLGIATAGLLVASAAQAQTVIVQAKCAGSGVYTEVGTWVDSSAESNLANPCGQGSRSSRTPGDYAEFTPTVPVAGMYSVSVCWGVFQQAGGTNKGANSENVAYTITDSYGNSNAVLNQRGQNGCPNTNADIWQPLGTAYFTPAGGGSIRITNTANGQCHNGSSKRYVNVDAVRLAYEGPTPVNPVSWGTIKVRHR